MLNREDVRRVLVARDKIANRYKQNNKEDVPLRVFLEDILKEIVINTTKSNNKTT